MKASFNLLILTLLLFCSTGEARVIKALENLTLQVPSGSDIIFSAPSLSASQPLKIGSSQELTSGAIDLTSEVTGSLPVANGGTGSATQNFVDLTTDQAVSGSKTFDKIIVESTSLASTPCPVMTTTQRDAISSPVTGECIYNSTTSVLNAYNGSSWVGVGSGGGGISEWVTTTSYSIGDVIHTDSKIYVALTAHTAGTFATDLGNGEWSELSPSLQDTTVTDGLLLIGSTGVGYVSGSLSGTVNQIETTYGSGSITLNLPQNIHSGASPTFVSATFSGVLPNEFIKTNGSSGLDSVSAIDLTSDVTGVLPIANGGTGSSTQNFVDLTTNQTIQGDKTVSGTLTTTFPFSAGQYTSASLPSALSYDGYIVYDTDDNIYRFSDGATWEPIGGVAETHQDVTTSASPSFSGILVNSATFVSGSAPATPVGGLGVYTDSSTGLISYKDTNGVERSVKDTKEADVLTNYSFEESHSGDPDVGWTITSASAAVESVKYVPSEGKQALALTVTSSAFEMSQTFDCSNYGDISLGFTGYVSASSSAEIEFCGWDGVTESGCSSLYPSSTATNVLGYQKILAEVRGGGTCGVKLKSDATISETIGVDAIKFTSEPYTQGRFTNGTQSSLLSNTTTFNNATITGALTSENGSGIYTYDSSTGIYTVLRSAVITISCSLSSASGGSFIGAEIKRDGAAGVVVIGIDADSSGSGYANVSATDDYVQGDSFYCSNNAANNTDNNKVIVSATASSDATIVPARIQPAIVRADGNGGTSITASVTAVDFNNETKDTSNSWDGTTFTAPRDGEYHFAGSIYLASPRSTRVRAYINGSGNKILGYDVSSDTITLSGQLTLSQGDAVTIRLDVTETLSNNAQYHYLAINEVQSSVDISVAIPSVIIRSEPLTIDAVTTAPTKGTTTTDAVTYYVRDGILTAHYHYHHTAGGVAGTGVYRFKLPNQYEIHPDWVQPESNYRATVGMGMISNHSLAQGSTTAVVRASMMSTTDFSLTYWSSITAITPISSTVFSLGSTNYTLSIKIEVPIKQ